MSFTAFADLTGLEGQMDAEWALQSPAQTYMRGSRRNLRSYLRLVVEIR